MRIVCFWVGCESLGGGKRTCSGYRRVWCSLCRSFLWIPCLCKPFADNKRNGFLHPAIAQSHPTQAHKRYSSNTLQPHKVTELTSTYSIPSLRDRKSPQKPCQSIFHKSSCQASFKKPRSPASPRSPSSINIQPEAPQGRPCGRRGRLCRRIWSRCCSGRTCRYRTSCAAPSSCRSASC